MVAPVERRQKHRRLSVGSQQEGAGLPVNSRLPIPNSQRFPTPKEHVVSAAGFLGVGRWALEVYLRAPNAARSVTGSTTRNTTAVPMPNEISSVASAARLS